MNIYELFFKFKMRNFDVPWQSKVTIALYINSNSSNSIFEMPIIPQTLNINNLRTTSAKSINLHTIGKLIEYSLNNASIKAMFSPTVFEILLSKCRSVLSPAQQVTGSERVNSNPHQGNNHLYL